VLLYHQLDLYFVLLNHSFSTVHGLVSLLFELARPTILALTAPIPSPSHLGQAKHVVVSHSILCPGQWGSILPLTYILNPVSSTTLPPPHSFQSTRKTRTNNLPSHSQQYALPLRSTTILALTAPIPSPSHLWQAKRVVVSHSILRPGLWGSILPLTYIVNPVSSTSLPPPPPPQLSVH
jgi:hypothetical protein